ncbi:NADPH dehydrogenase [Psittacicella hinzii]|uniref:NADPH dehydrogenase n=1 Tax=Psittacicella hinzii TaxID=2028575 RepID=A0A3A1YAI4_9GAMM|nr:NADPH dehydrogenase [Psittacicella hinzii]RIY34551.1 NADPH dehydrogenase [Psittacicella hinzii]
MAKSKLFTPVTIGANTFKNRVFMSPMCMYSAEPHTGLLNQKHFDHYLSRALGGVGAIIVEATSVQPQGGISKLDLGLWNDEQARAFSGLTAAVHSYNCKIGIQLSHSGRKGQDWEVVYAPSAVGAFSPEYKEPVALTTEQVEKFIEDYLAAAKRAEMAGFDFIEIHAAHGYLINQFLSPITNQRDDQFGGSLEKRYELLGRLIRGIKANTSLDVYVRFSANEVEESGNSFEEMQMLLHLAYADGAVFFDISSGGITPTSPEVFPGYQALLSAEFSKAGLPVGAVGLLDTPELAEYVLRANHAQVIFIGRGLLTNPNWALNAAHKLHALEQYDFAIDSYKRGIK